MLSLTDGKNQTTRWNYDEYGRVTNKLDQVGAKILRYKYDPNSRLTNRWSAAKTNTYYAYDPVGNLTNIIISCGTLASANVYRFSSKELHANSGLFYYGFRSYHPNLQRWPNRDPSGAPEFEALRRRKGKVPGDGPNLYLFVRNNPMTGTDFLGLQLAGRGGIPPSPNAPKDPCPCGEAVAQIAAVGPIDANTARRLANEALAAARASGLPGLHNGQADAFRHCFWSCRMAQEIGAGQAKEVGDTQERCDRNPVGEEAMDQANNAACLQAARDGTLQTSPSGTPPANPY